MKNKVPRIIELTWLITSILCLLTAVHQTIYEGFQKSYLFYIFAIIAFLMYSFRKHIRKSNNTPSTNE